MSDELIPPPKVIETDPVVAVEEVTRWSLYSKATGSLTGITLNCSEAIARRYERGDIGVVKGHHDHTNSRIAAGKVEPWQPPSPGDDDMRTWAWDANARRWIDTPTPAAIAVDMRRERDARLAATDWLVTRASEGAGAVPQAWRQYRQALRDVTNQPSFPSNIVWPEEPKSTP